MRVLVETEEETEEDEETEDKEETEDEETGYEEEELNPPNILRIERARKQGRSQVENNVNRSACQTATSSLAPTTAVINNNPASHSIDSTCVFQCAAGGAGQISTASLAPTIARRDEEGSRHRRRRKEMGVETVEYENMTRPASTMTVNTRHGAPWSG